MASGISCITCTKNRPLAFNLCKKWMDNQTVKPDNWIIISDGASITADLPSYATYRDRARNVNEPEHTMILNLLEALKYVAGKKILIWEDDEYYSPKYIETMSKLLDTYDLVGITKPKYYYLPTFKYHKHTNFKEHASFAETAFNASILPDLIDAADGDPNDSQYQFIDARLWKLCQERGRNTYLFDDDMESLYVGMKGLPGSMGIGCGHVNDPWYKPDLGKAILKKWIPNEDDFFTYVNFNQAVQDLKILNQAEDIKKDERRYQSARVINGKSI